MHLMFGKSSLYILYLHLLLHLYLFIEICLLRDAHSKKNRRATRSC